MAVAAELAAAQIVDVSESKLFVPVSPFRALLVLVYSDEVNILNLCTRSKRENRCRSMPPKGLRIPEADHGIKYNRSHEMTKNDRKILSCFCKEKACIDSSSSR